MPVAPEPLHTPAPAPRKDNIPAGIAWMLITGFFFVAVTGIVRYLGSSLPPAEGAFIRYAAGLVMVAPALAGFIRRRPEARILRKFAWRGMLHGLGVMLWFYAMARIPVAEVTALGYTSPLFITVLAAIFLGEKLRMRRILAILAGLVGVAIIIRPGFNEIGSGQIAQLLAAPIFAGSYILAKQLSDHAKPGEIVAMLSLGCTITLFPFALMEWRTPELHEVLWLCLVAIFATTGHYTMTRAYKCAPISVTQPVTFLQIVWATILGAVAFGEEADIFVMLGAAIVLGSAWYITMRELRARRTRPKESRRPITGKALR